MPAAGRQVGEVSSSSAYWTMTDPKSGTGVLMLLPAPGLLLTWWRCLWRALGVEGHGHVEALAQQRRRVPEGLGAGGVPEGLARAGGGRGGGGGWRLGSLRGRHGLNEAVGRQVALQHCTCKHSSISTCVSPLAC